MPGASSRHGRWQGRQECLEPQGARRDKQNLVTDNGSLIHFIHCKDDCSSVCGQRAYFLQDGVHTKGVEPNVGSSRKMTGGLANSVRTSCMRLSCPPETWAGSLRRIAVRPNRSIKSGIRRRRSFRERPIKRASNSICCSTVNPQSTASAWDISPIDRRTKSRSCLALLPRISTSPLVIGITVVMVCTRVVFPAPFGPRSPVTVPFGIVKQRSAIAGVGRSRYYTVRSRASTAVMRVISFRRQHKKGMRPAHTPVCSLANGRIAAGPAVSARQTHPSGSMR